MIPFVYLATSSARKKQQFETLVAEAGFQLETLPLELPEIQDVDVEKVSLQKLAWAARQTEHRPLFVDDAGLSIDSLGGFPGALLKPILENGGITLFDKLTSSQQSSRRLAATFLSSISIAVGGEVHSFVGKMPGVLHFDVPGVLDDKDCLRLFHSPEGHSLKELSQTLGASAFRHREDALSQALLKLKELR